MMKKNYIILKNIFNKKCIYIHYIYIHFLLNLDIYSSPFYLVIAETCLLSLMVIGEWGELWFERSVLWQAFIQALLSKAIFPQRFSFFTICIVHYSQEVLPCYVPN